MNRLTSALAPFAIACAALLITGAALAARSNPTSGIIADIAQPLFTIVALIFVAKTISRLVRR